MIVDVVIAGGAVDALTLRRVMEAIPAALVREVLAVASADESLGVQLDGVRAKLCAALPPPDVVVFLSPDGSDDPAELGLLLAPLRAGAADLVMGSRALGRAERGAPGCRLGQRLGALLIGLFYGQRYSDLSPYRAIRMPAWVVLALHERGNGYLIEMQIKAARAGLRVVEVPVHARRVVRPPLARRLRALAGASWRFSYLLLRQSTAR